MGRSRRSALSSSRSLVSSFSLASSSLRAASHASRVAIRGRLITVSFASAAWSGAPAHISYDQMAGSKSSSRVGRGIVVAFLLVSETAVTARRTYPPHPPQKASGPASAPAREHGRCMGGSASHRIRRDGGPKWSRTPRQKTYCRTVAATPYSGAAGGGGRAQAGAKRSLSPNRRSTERNHKVDAPVPAITSAAVARIWAKRLPRSSVRGPNGGLITFSARDPTEAQRGVDTDQRGGARTVLGGDEVSERA